MQIFTSTPDEYVASLPPERQEVIEKLRTVIVSHLPSWFEECMSYGMIGYVVPHSLYSSGYHCDPSLPLPFLSIASQKNSINLYHMGIYADPDLLKWWEEEYAKLGIGKLDMGKSCTRWKEKSPLHRGEEPKAKGGFLIPYDLIGKLVEKMSVDAWIELYEWELKSH
jgi:hypothetical protein